MEQSLSDLKKFCDDDINGVPSTAFDDFAKATGFNPNTFLIASDGKLKTIDSLLSLWKEFIEKEGIKL
jgi:hypothetical protein